MVNNGDLVDAAEAQRILGLSRSWFYAHVAPRLAAYPVEWDAVRPSHLQKHGDSLVSFRKRRGPEQIRRGRPTGCGKHMYSRAEVKALRQLRDGMLAVADTAYVPWLLVLQALPASHRRATASSAASQ